MRTATFALIVTTTLLSPRYASAEKSNQTQVRASLSKGGYTVIYGDKFTESDWIAAGASIYASIQAGNPEPFFKWMTSELNATVNKVQQQLPGVGSRPNTSIATTVFDQWESRSDQWNVHFCRDRDL